MDLPEMSWGSRPRLKAGRRFAAAKKTFEQVTQRLLAIIAMMAIATKAMKMRVPIFQRL